MIKLSKNNSSIAFPISRLLPNIITIMAICFGLSSMRYALKQQWMLAVAFVVVAGFLDLVDGRLARFLKATSNFGAQLDSLADFANFGIAPSVILYTWYLNNVPVSGLGWAVCMFFTVCTAIRLARFNTDLVQTSSFHEWRNLFFIGIPSPAGAYLAMLPIMISFEYDILSHISPSGLALYVAFIGILMISRIPTFATKKIVIKREYISHFLIFAALFMTSIIIQPWVCLSIYGFIYIISIPLSCFIHYKKSKKSEVL